MGEAVGLSRPAAKSGALAVPLIARRVRQRRTTEAAMDPMRIEPELVLRIYQALILWVAGMSVVTSLFMFCMYLFFLWRECFSSRAQV